MNKEENGYLYVVSGKRWSFEAMKAITRLRSLSEYPICVICDKNYENLQFLANKINNFELKILPNLENKNFVSKVLGMINTPFLNTLYMDTDTFVVENVDTVFSLTDFCDMSLSINNVFSTSLNSVTDKYKNVFSEFNTGVILYKSTKDVFNLLNEWYNNIQKKHYSNDYFDMPQFRNTLINTEFFVRILPLHENYNSYGYRTYKIISGKVYIIHERFGTYWNSYSEKMLDSDKMEKIAKQINRKTTKRLFIPFLNITISTLRISIPYLLTNLKKRIGFKKISKSEAY
jgi:hypothetical protein